jgi:peroxiredoxin
MKYSILLIAIIFISCNSGNNVVIDGIVKNRESGIVTMFQSGDTYQTAQKDTVKNGKFHFEVKIEHPENIWLSYDMREVFSVFVEPSSKVKVILYPDSLQFSEISGSKISETFAKTDKIRIIGFTKLSKLLNDYNHAAETNDKSLQSKIMKEGDSLNADLQRWEFNYIKHNTNSYFSAYYLYTLHSNLNIDTLRRYYFMLDNSLKESVYTKTIKTYLSVLPGKHFQDFELYDAKNNLVKFSDIARNNIVLIHFWFSSCSPCRAQNSRLRNIYELYKSKGFEIVGISTDKDQTDFVKTIKDDGMSWINLHDRSDRTAVRYIYDITTYPTNLILDRNGIVVAKDIPLDRLDLTIDSLVKL